MKELLSITNSLSEEEQQSIDLSVQKKAIELLYRNGLRAIPFNIINPLILAVLFVSQQSHIYIYIWLALHILVSTLRYLHILKRLPSMPEGQISNSAYLKEFIGASTVSALIWGLGFYFMIPLLSEVSQFIFLLVVTGMAAGAYASMSTHRLTYAMYLLGIFIPVTITLFTSYQSAISGNILSFFIIAFVAMLLVTHKLSNKLILNSIRSDITKNILIKKLQSADSNKN